jgi:glycosyltransferase involved in cell wall biosynthesis
VPYVVTLHGSYDVMDFSKPGSQALLKAVAADATAWIYTADRNLKVFAGCGLDRRPCFKVNNAMPADPTPFPKTRAELGIDPDTVVFTLVARGIERKGWRAAVQSIRALRRARPHDKIHLLLVGEGEKAEAAMALVAPDDPITWLGFQTAINGLYRISDCAVVPTRFPGESNPLCLIQAIQDGLPVIATDIGEIRNMLTLEGEVCGILLEEKRDTAAFTADLQAAMADVLGGERRAELAAQSRRLAAKFDITRMVGEYQAVFDAARDALRHARLGQAAE